MAGPQKMDELWHQNLYYFILGLAFYHIITGTGKIYEVKTIFANLLRQQQMRILKRRFYFVAKNVFTILIGIIAQVSIRHKIYLCKIL
jgi:hypothetical protein